MKNKLRVHQFLENLMLFQRFTKDRPSKRIKGWKIVWECFFYLLKIRLSEVFIRSRNLFVFSPRTFTLITEATLLSFWWDGISWVLTFRLTARISLVWEARSVSPGWVLLMCTMGDLVTMGEAGETPHNWLSLCIIKFTKNMARYQSIKLHSLKQGLF